MEKVKGKIYRSIDGTVFASKEERDERNRILFYDMLHDKEKIEISGELRDKLYEQVMMDAERRDFLFQNFPKTS